MSRVERLFAALGWLCVLTLLAKGAPLRAQDAPAPVSEVDVKPEDLAQPPAPEPTPSPAPTPGPSPKAEMKLSVLAGGLVSLSSGAEAATSPLARISVEAPLADYERPPRLLVHADLSALPGESLSISQTDTFRSLELGIGFGWQPFASFRFSFYALGGFATRLPGDPEPLERTARFASAGIRFADERGNLLEVGAGPDQRLDGTYQPAVQISGAVRLWEARDDVGVHLVARAILGLDPSQRYLTAGGPRDVVQLGMAVTKR